VVSAATLLAWRGRPGPGSGGAAARRAWFARLFSSKKATARMRRSPLARRPPSGP